MKTNHEIDYRILGNEMQCVEIELDPQETVMAEPGSFMAMDNSIQMETIFGDGSKQTGGLLGKLMNAGKRVLTGESLFMTAFTNMEKSFRLTCTTWEEGSSARKIPFYVQPKE
jgi:uncharacterized protein (AIM24 family)